MTSPLMLVTGATGYIASRLIPRLLESGYHVRAMARESRHLQARSWFDKIDIVQADVTIPSTLPEALEGVDTAYYLIHNMSRGHGYTTLELDGARNFAKAAENAGIKHIIYLGGLADPEQHIAPHMRSRIETGKALRAGKVPVTEFRAGVITGSGSISFEMIRFMTELFPVVPGPLRLKNKSQPIAIQNIIDYLIAALENKSEQGQVFEIGGPEVTTYEDLMLCYARARGLKRSILLFPGIPVWFMAFGVGLMTPVPYPIAHALLGGLSADSVVKHPKALEVFPEVKLIDFDTATKDALAKTHPAHIERVWEVGGDFGRPSNDNLGQEVWLKHEGCFINYRTIIVNSSTESVFQELVHMVNKRYGLTVIKAGNNSILVCEKNQRFGKEWIEWRVVGRTLALHLRAGVDNPTYITQTVFFSPHGLPGFLYWIFLYPFHWLRFRGLIRGIAAQSENS